MILGNHKINIIIILLLYLFLSFDVFTKPIQGQSVDIQILDKITSQIKNINLKVNNLYLHESLKIEIYACYKRPPEEIPEDFVLIKIFDVINKDLPELIFQGWMISSSPSVTPFEHPIYDIIIKECKI